MLSGQARLFAWRANLAPLRPCRYNPAMHRRLLALVAILSFASPLLAAEPLAWDTFADTWVATDALGRALPTRAEAGPPRDGRFVGMFYFLWLGGHGRQLHDLSHILAADPANPPFGPPGAFHFWAEPLFGYYLSDDPSIIRKHAQQLADAGVDVLFFDVTNGFTYEPACLAVCKVLEEMRAAGQRHPQIAFLTHSQGPKVVRKLHDDFYAKGVHRDLWFRWQGKPLILAKEGDVAPELRGFFTIRESWAWTNAKGWFGDGRDKWPWLDHHPQKPGWHDGPDKPEQIPVCAAQHPTSNIGRSFHNGKQPPAGQVAPEMGLCFAEQFEHSLKVDPQFIFVTGWNEWVAQRFVKKPREGAGQMLGVPLKDGESFFVDQYNQEFSRDIEPMKGGHGDNYYYQFAAYIRRYKGVRAVPPVSPRPVAIDARFDDWAAVTPEFRDTIGDPVRRDNPGWTGGGPYVNTTGRNDIVAAKVSFDARNLYFHVRTREPFAADTEAEPMLLFLDLDASTRTGWLGYDARIAGKSIQRSTSPDYQWKEAGEAILRSAGNELEVSVPLSALGLTRLPAAIHFKWADNCIRNKDWTDFTLNGDAAPNDRFNYRAVFGGR